SRGLARICVYFRQDGAYVLADRFQDLAEVFEEIVAEVWSPSRLIQSLSIADKIRLLARNFLQTVKGQKSFLSASVCLLLQLILLPFRRRIFRAEKVSESLLAPLIRARLGSQQVAWLLQDFDNQNYTAFYREFPQARVFVFPHGTNWLANQQFPEKTS